jgi:hypothetical protein
MYGGIDFMGNCKVENDPSMVTLKMIIYLGQFWLCAY